MCDDIIRDAPGMGFDQLQSFVRNDLLTAARRINCTEHLEIGQTPTNAVHIDGTLAVRQVGLQLLVRKRVALRYSAINLFIGARGAVRQIVKNAGNELIELGKFNLSGVRQLSGHRCISID